MKNRILIMSVFAALILLSIPMVSNIQAKMVKIKEQDDCDICGHTNFKNEDKLAWFPGKCIICGIIAITMVMIVIPANIVWKIFGDIPFLDPIENFLILLSAITHLLDCQYTHGPPD